MKLNQIVLLFSLFYSHIIHSQTINVTTNNDSGSGSLRQAITDINSGSDSSNTINLQIPGNSPISIASDLPVIKKNTTIISTGNQTINGNGEYRLFATIMADLSLASCTLQSGAAIGGNGGGGGMGAGGGVYIDRGNTVTLTQATITHCKAQGGEGGNSFGRGGGGGGASFATLNKHGSETSGGGDYPGLSNESGGASDSSSFLTGYGGGNGGSNRGGKGGGNGPGLDGSSGGAGGYCGGGGGVYGTQAGGGGNGGGMGFTSAGGGGFGSGGGALVNENSGGGGFGGGGGNSRYAGGGGGFGGGGGDSNVTNLDEAGGGRYGGNAGSTEKRGSGGGAGLGGAIFVGDTAKCILKDNAKIFNNQVVGGKASGGNSQPGQGYAPDIFLFRKATLQFNNSAPLDANFQIQADLNAPAGHLDQGIIKQGPGTLTLSNINNNYRGGTQIQAGTLSLPDPKALGSPTANLTLNGGTLQATQTYTLTNPIIASSTGAIDVAPDKILYTTGNISGTGSIDKTESGTWHQAGISTHTGNLHLEQGTLQIDGTLPSNITVNPGGMLQGGGIAGGNLTNNGTLSPSSAAVGTLTVGGNYTQTPSGTLHLELLPNSMSNHLTVIGTATLDGALYLHLEPGIYPLDQPYNLIHADSGLTGLFPQISSNAILFNQLAQIQTTPTDYILTFQGPQIILPIPNDQLPSNPKNIANYLFCNNFPFQNTSLVNLLQNIFPLSINAYQKALSSLTPEHYGALPIGESRTIQYLLTKAPTCSSDTPLPSQSLILLPLYYRNQIDKHNSLPNYTQNTAGLRLQHQIIYPSNLQLQTAASYLHTHTQWGQDHRGKANSNGAYLDAELHYQKNNLSTSFTLLGAYSYIDTTHTLFIGYPIKAEATPHIWDIAEKLHLQYTHTYKSISYIPKLELTQTNIFVSSIHENKPKELPLQTESKYFGFLDTLLSFRTQAQKKRPLHCAQAYLDLGWHNILHLSNKDFHSRLDNYTVCGSSFTTTTYTGSTNLFFMEWGITLAYKKNFDLLLNYRTEVGKGDLVQGVYLGVNWGF